MKKKYMIHAGTIISATDGDEHYIGYNQLIQLYMLDPKECFPAPERIFGGAKDNFIHVFPRHDGHYPCFGKHVSEKKHYCRKHMD
jgi:hypothetical protein